MAKTYSQLQTQIQTQIQKLQKEAEALRKQEVAGVVARIQEAIAHYGLTQQDLFGVASQVALKAKRQATTKKAAHKLPSKPAKVPAAPKYADDAGHSWSGIGKRPNWFKAALAAGKTAQDLLVKPAA